MRAKYFPIHLTYRFWQEQQKVVTHISNHDTIQLNSTMNILFFFFFLSQLPLEWCKQPDVGLPKPDCVIFLQLSPEAGAKRNGFGEERYEKTQFQNKVLEQFMQIKDESWKVSTRLTRKLKSILF